MFVCMLALHILLFYDIDSVVIKVVNILPTSFHLGKRKGAALIFTTWIYLWNISQMSQSLNTLSQFILCIPIFSSFLLRYGNIPLNR